MRATGARRRAAGTRATSPTRAGRRSPASCGRCSTARDHERTGTEDNDELLGHHGDDTVVGLDGKDVLWGDWELKGNATNQSDVMRGGDGNDFLYPSHGKNN